MAAEERLQARQVHRTLALQLRPEGADRGHHIMGLRQERLGVWDRTIQGPDGPAGSTSMASLTAFHRWTMSWAWRRHRSLMARLRWAARSARNRGMSSSRAAACLPNSFCSWFCVAGGILGNAPLSASVSRSAGSEWTPCRAAFAWYAAGARAARASYRRNASRSCFPVFGGVHAHRVGPHPGDGCRRAPTRARASRAAWKCSTTLSTAAAGMDP